MCARIIQQKISDFIIRSFFSCVIAKRYLIYGLYMTYNYQRNSKITCLFKHITILFKLERSNDIYCIKCYLKQFFSIF